MDGFLKIVAGTIVTIVLCLTVSKQSKDISAIIVGVACVMIAVTALSYLHPVISFFSQLRSMGKFDFEIMSILLRSVGIGIITEIISLLCIDVGNAALGKTLQLTGGAAILWLSLPLFTKLLELIEEVLLVV